MDGRLKTGAMICVLTYLQEGFGRFQGDPPPNLEILVDMVSLTSVLFWVEFGGEKPLGFYYNEPNYPLRVGGDYFISVEKGGRAISSKGFVEMIVLERNMGAIAT